jgi:hypothetical protein
LYHIPTLLNISKVTFNLSNTNILHYFVTVLVAVTVVGLVIVEVVVLVAVTVVGLVIVEVVVLVAVTVVGLVIVVVTVVNVQREVLAAGVVDLERVVAKAIVVVPDGDGERLPQDPTAAI